MIYSSRRREIGGGSFINRAFSISQNLSLPHSDDSLSLALYMAFNLSKCLLIRLFYIAHTIKLLQHSQVLFCPTCNCKPFICILGHSKLIVASEGNFGGWILPSKLKS